MLTDEEIIKIAADTKTGEPGLHGYILPISFAREIERAVLAKAMQKQEPVAWNRYDSDKFVGTVYKLPSGMYNKNIRYEPLYADPQPAQAAAIPEQWRVTGYGQIKKGDVISMVMAGRRICTSAKEVLNAGTNEEEVVYNRKKNHYFITGMVLDGTSNHKDVFIIPSDSLSASPKPDKS